MAAIVNLCWTRAKFFLEFDFRFFIAYHSAMDKPRENGALLIAACIVAAIRLRGEPIARSPKVIATIAYNECAD
jgi:hypothetical protein